jgi:hypothetical protein
MISSIAADWLALSIGPSLGAMRLARKLSKSELAGVFLILSLLCLVFGYLTAIQQQSIGAVELEDSMALFGVVFFVLFLAATYLALKR